MQRPGLLRRSVSLAGLLAALAGSLSQGFTAAEATMLDSLHRYASG